MNLTVFIGNTVGHSKLGGANNYFTISEINENSEFVLSSLLVRPTSNVINGSQVSANYSYSTSEGYNGEGIINSHFNQNNDLMNEELSTGI